MKDFYFTGTLGDIIQELIEEKKAMGLKYNLQGRLLKNFDTFSKHFNLTETALTRDIVEKWIEKKPNETHQNQKMRIQAIRQLALYMQRQGYTTYIPSADMFFASKSNFVPYIFNDNELKNFFIQADSMKVQKLSPIKHMVIPLIFKILYGCGLRVSEALNLRVKDVDIIEGTFKIYFSKFNHQRLVPMSKSLLQECKNYFKTVHPTSTSEDIFLPSPLQKVYSVSLVYREFRKLLWRARISHGGKGCGPRVHDFRHTFAVNCLKNWVLTGVDLNATLPILSKYLGHVNLKETQHYLRLTAELYPDITEKFGKKFGYCIPENYGGDDSDSY